MRRDEILAFLRAQPFQPFRIRLSGGIEHEIRHPDMAIVTPSAIHVGVPGNGTGLATRVVVVSLIHVIQVEHLQPATPPTVN
jgi:hypothetical protein